MLLWFGMVGMVVMVRRYAWFAYENIGRGIRSKKRPVGKAEVATPRSQLFGRNSFRYTLPYGGGGHRSGASAAPGIGISLAFFSYSKFLATFLRTAATTIMRGPAFAAEARLVDGGWSDQMQSVVVISWSVY